jgi:hypothetical protein
MTNSQSKLLIERREPRITLAPPVRGRRAMPAGFVLAPKPSDCVPLGLVYGIAQCKVKGHSAYRVHFCHGSFSPGKLERYTQDMRKNRLTTIHAMVHAILVFKDQVSRDQYQIAKQAKTAIVSYGHFCDYLDALKMVYDLAHAGRARS